MDDLSRTLGAIAERRWTVVLLEPGTKRLREGRTWDECSTRSVAEVRTWLRHGGGVGLDVHASGLIVVDLDAPKALERLYARVGPLSPTSTSPSGGHHVYLAAPGPPPPGARALRRPDGHTPVPEASDAGHGRVGVSPGFQTALPGVVLLDGERLGEVIQGPRQQVVLPPTPYPGNVKRGVPVGGHYSWLADPRLPPYVMPLALFELLASDDLPLYLQGGEALGVLPPEPWTGPPAGELLRRAYAQPGGRRRARGVKFQCPECRQEGHDRHRDNAFVGLDGRWGCAYAPGDADHRRAIGVALDAMGSAEEAQLAEETVDDAIVRRIREGL